MKMGRLEVETAAIFNIPTHSNYFDMEKSSWKPKELTPLNQRKRGVHP